MNKGVVYIIGGEKYAKMALASILSLRKNGGRAGKQPIHVYYMGEVFFDGAFNNLGCSIIPCSCNKISQGGHRLVKSTVMQEVSFDKYIMIDADTFVQGDFYELFDLIPEDGVAGIGDGNFQSHLQMAEFLFLNKNGKKKGEIRETVKELLGVDYGEEINFPPYFNVGVLGLSLSASKKIGEKLYPLLEALSATGIYNPHDEQLPLNSILYHDEIPAVEVNPIFNYTRSRMKHNIKNGTHDSIKDTIRVIHNRHYPKEANWIDTKSIIEEVEKLIKQ